MDIRTPGFTRFSRFGANLGRIHATEARHTEGLDGTDTLEITCCEDLNKNDYIVWLDRRGIWHEHIVDSHRRTHDDTGAPMTVATCINSIAETWDDYVEDKRPSGSAYVALTSILATSRWAAGTCTQNNTASHTFYHISVREALQELLETWGGELETVISCDGDRVTGRKVRICSVRGNQNSAKRFTWSKDLVSIARDVASDNPKSRLYAYGKGEETDSGGYGRRIGIAKVNGGLPYVEDAEATKLWGHPTDSGTIAPACGVYVNETCDDPATLLKEAKAALKAAKVPKVTYVADVLDLVSFGRDWEDVALGDLVTIVDKGFSDEGIRLKGRVSKLERDLFTYDTTVTFGNLVDAIATPWQSLQSKVSSLSTRASNWDLAGTASQGWLDTLMGRLNAAYNQAGTYHYSSFEQGEIWSNVPLDENGRATKSGGWAMNINGMGFRLASSLNADGSWNWRAFGNGNGFTADEINAGRIHGILIEGNTVKGGTIEGTTVKGGTIEGTKITGGTIEGTKITGGTVNGATVTSNGELSRVVMRDGGIKTYYRESENGEWVLAGAISSSHDVYDSEITPVAYGADFTLATNKTMLEQSGQMTAVSVTNKTYTRGKALSGTLKLPLGVATKNIPVINGVEHIEYMVRPGMVELALVNGRICGVEVNGFVPGSDGPTFEFYPEHERDDIGAAIQYASSPHLWPMYCCSVEW